MCVEKFEHITLTLKELHWLPVQQRITYKILVLAYKTLHDQAPPYIRSLLVPYNPIRQLQSSNKLSLKVPHHNTKSYGAWTLSVFVPAEYNKLPLSVTSASTVNAFKFGLKTYLFTIAFYDSL